MIKTEIIKINDNDYVRTFSDSNRYVVREGISYEEAIDPVESGREYTEGELIEVIAEPTPEATEEA